MNSRQLRWMGHVERWGRRDMHARIRGGRDLRERDSWEDLGVDGSIVLIIDVKRNYTVRT
jgi:hypothetical protein